MVPYSMSSQSWAMEAVGAVNIYVHKATLAERWPVCTDDWTHGSSRSGLTVPDTEALKQDPPFSANHTEKLEVRTLNTRHITHLIHRTQPHCRGRDAQMPDIPPSSPNILSFSFFSLSSKAQQQKKTQLKKHSFL